MVSSTFLKTSLLKWDAVHQTQKKIAEAEGKRNIEGDHLQAVLQIVDLTAVRNREESQGHDLEISSFIHIRTRKGKLNSFCIYR